MKRTSASSFINRNAVRLSWGFFGISAFIASGMLAIVLADRRNPELLFLAPQTLTLTVTSTTTPVHTSSPTSTITPTATFTPTLTLTPIPSAGEIFSIGKTVEDRPLEVYRFGDGSIVRMVIGGIHGGYEANTSKLIDALIEDLRSNLIIVPEDVTLYLLPVFNSDGFHNFANLPTGRPNANGVDLNRNWSVFWQTDWKKNGCFNTIPITGGKFPFSEPETQALRDFLVNNHVDALISYHSAMSAIYAGGRPKPDSKSDSLGRTLAHVSPYLYPPVNDPGCEYTGQLIDWASENGIAAVDVELTNHKETDISINRKILQSFLTWIP